MVEELGGGRLPCTDPRRFDWRLGHRALMMLRGTPQIACDLVQLKRSIERSTYMNGEAVPDLPEVGAIVSGVVMETTSFGAFVAVDAVPYQGLCLIPDISWGRVRSPADHLDVGQRVEMVVLKHVHERQVLRLGLKQMTADPWDLLGERLEPGQRFDGATVVSCADFGVFVELSEHVEGLVHVDDLREANLGVSPYDLLGGRLDVVVEQVDRARRQIRLAVQLNCG